MRPETCSFQLKCFQRPARFRRNVSRDLLVSVEMSHPLFKILVRPFLLLVRTGRKDALTGGCFCCFLVGRLTSQQHASVSQRRICSDRFTCCHTDIEAADQTSYLIQSQYNASITPGVWRVATGVPLKKSLVRLNPDNPHIASGNRTPGSSALDADALPTRSTRRY